MGIREREDFPKHPWRLSSIVDDTKAWTIFRNYFPDYMIDFNRVDKENWIPSFIDYLRTQETATIIDFMASTDAVRSLARGLLRNVDVHGIAVGFSDRRTDEEKEQDTTLGISFVPGNLNKGKTWNDITEKLNGKKADLIMERGYGGLHYIPTDRRYQRVALGKMWNMLGSENSMLIVQTPPQYVLEKRGIPVANWLKKLKKEEIPYQFLPQFQSKDGDMPYGLLAITKHSDAPLPDIDN